MARYVDQLRSLLVILLMVLVQSSQQDTSTTDMTTMGKHFVPADSSLSPIDTLTTTKRLYCSLECNKRFDCRTFDFDGQSKQCRLWDADQTTGSIASSPMKPQSSVGTIRLTPAIYARMHNQSCDRCVLSRYETCDANSSTCQCPAKTFWDGSMCQVQRLRNQTCSRTDHCRSDLNLGCQPSCDFTYRCSTPPGIGVGETVAGYCNFTSSTNLTEAQDPWGLHLLSNGYLYIADWDLQKYQVVSPFSRTTSTIFSGSLNTPCDIFLDSSNTVYMTDYGLNGGTAFIQRTGVLQRRFPAAGLSTASCLSNGLCTAYGIAVDRSGNIYISMYQCFVVMKWAPNATSGVVVAGQPGTSGSSNRLLDYIRFIHLDEDRGYLYVSDSGNDRVQRFVIGGNGTGVTVAGTGTGGTGLNQLDSPSGIHVTADGLTLYVVDCNNNRVMKWTIGASYGSVVAGSVTGVAGRSTTLLDYPGDVVLDPTETYLYVADGSNHRVQRFRLH